MAVATPSETADSRAWWSGRYAADLAKPGEESLGQHEWHLDYAAIKELIKPHLRRLSSTLEGPFRILDVGCGTSAFGTSLLEDVPNAEVTLLDVHPLIGALEKRYAGDARLHIVADDCRSLERIEDNSVTLAIDKGTLDALDTKDVLPCLKAILRKLQCPHGLLVAVSFSAASRVLILRRQAEEMGLDLHMQFVAVGRESRLVAFVSQSLGEAGAAFVPAPLDAFSERKMGELIYGGPLWLEQFVNFDHPGLPGLRITLEQSTEEQRTASGDDATGHLVWPASHSLAAHLIANPDLVRGKRVVELGAGTGLPGLVCAALGAKEVVLTDLAGTMPLLRRNLEANSAAAGGKVSTCELWWGAEHVKAAGLQEFDVVIGCELIYRLSTETYQALVDTMVMLAGDSGICLFVYEFRDGLAEDFEFFERANARFDVEVHSVARYGYGLSADDDNSRLLYVYKPYPKPA